MSKGKISDTQDQNAEKDGDDSKISVKEQSDFLDSLNMSQSVLEIE